MLARIRSFFDGLFRRTRIEDNLAEELRLHIEERADVIERTGVDRAEALRRARLEFGAVENYKERCREARGLRWPDELRQDLRYAIRAARKSPGVTVVAILSLALGIGANTAIFSILNSLLLTPLSVRDPGRLVILDVWRTQGRGAASYPLYLKLREGLRDKLLEDVCASGSPAAITVSVQGSEPVKAVQELVTANYFDVLGVRLIAGQAFGKWQEALGSAPVAVISERFWRRLGGDPVILGKTLGIGDKRVPVIGIAGGEFGGTEIGASVDVWSNVTSGDQTRLVDEGWNFLSIFARLGPTSRVSEIQAATTTVVERLQNERAGKMLASERSRRLAREARVVVEPGATGISKLRQRFALPLRIVMGVVALVLLIACANITNLLLARAAARQREIATRLSLGAGPGRLFRQFLTESMLLAIGGGLLGLLVAKWTSSLLLGLIPPGSVPLALDVHLNWRVLLFTSAVSITVGLLFGIVPALRVSRTQLASTLRASSSGTVRPGKLLSVAQIALSTMLVFAAGLFVRTLVNLKNVDSGFRPEHVVTFDLAMPKEYSETKKVETERLAVERLSALPGVASASMCWPGAFNGGRFSGNFQIPGAPIPESQQRDIDYLLVSPNFFRTMGSTVMAGRDFEGRDSASARPNASVKIDLSGVTVAIVNESLARTYFPGRNPVGLKIQPFPQSSTPVVAEIVGVARDIRHFGLREKPTPALYLPMSEMDAPWAPTVEIRLSKDLGAVAREFQRALAEIDPRLGIVDLQTMDQAINTYLEKERLLATIGGLFSSVALVLAAVGLYGVMSYAVARRTKEFGLRMALGAQRRQVLDMIFRDGVGVALLGVALGVPAAMALSRFLASLLFDVKAGDVGSLFAPMVVMLGTAMIAVLLPAWRATRVDPMVALREE
ncbi:MAG TPA: ABC transporter permease [Bryobacteraceae bacterium]|nr:ABC transporter permease [Bryobacteraceae bacterium]